MKAVVVTAPGEYAWTDIPEPRPAPNEALVKIAVCGICNSTDLELAAGTQPYRPPTPFVLGHEAVGTVVEVGSECRKYKVGDLVTRAAAIMPGSQRDGLNSGWGGFAEYGIVRDAPPGDYTPDRQVVLPDMAPEDAFVAISLAETRSFLEVVMEVHGGLKGKSVAVLGTGIAGLTLTQWAAEQGAFPLISLGRRPEKLRLARCCGARETLRLDDPGLVEQIRELTGGRMIEVMLEAIGKPEVLAKLTPLLAPGALVAVYGAAEQAAYQQAFDAMPEGVTVTKPGPEEHRFTRKMAEALADGTFDPAFWRTHVWTADELPQAFAQVARGEVLKGCIRIG